MEINCERERLLEGFRRAQKEAIVKGKPIGHEGRIIKRELPNGVFFVTQNGVNYFLAENKKVGMRVALCTVDTKDYVHFEAPGVGTVNFMKGRCIDGRSAEQIITCMINGEGKGELGLNFDAPDLTIGKILGRKLKKATTYYERSKTQTAIELYGKIEELLDKKLRPDEDEELKLELTDEIKPQAKDLKAEEELDLGIE